MRRTALSTTVFLVATCAGAGAAESPPFLHGSMAVWDERPAEEPSPDDDWPGAEDSARQRRAIDDIYDLEFWKYQVSEPGVSEAPTSTADLVIFTAAVSQAETLTSTATLTLTDTLTSAPAQTPFETLTGTVSPTLTLTPTLTQTLTPTLTQTQTLTGMVSPTPTLTQTQTQTLTQQETGSLVDETDTKKKSGAAALRSFSSIVLGLVLLLLSGHLE